MFTTSQAIGERPCHYGDGSRMPRRIENNKRETVIEDVSKENTVMT